MSLLLVLTGISWLAARFRIIRSNFVCKTVPTWRH